MGFEFERAQARKDFLNGTPGAHAPRFRQSRGYNDYYDESISLQIHPPIVSHSKPVQFSLPSLPSSSSSTKFDSIEFGAKCARDLAARGFHIDIPSGNDSGSDAENDSGQSPW